MPALPILLQIGLLYGGLMSLAIMIVMGLGLALNPALFVGDYPPDIRAKYGPLDAHGQRQKYLIAIPFLAAIVGPLVALVVHLDGLVAGEPPFGAIFLAAFVAALVFNVVDLLIIDWLFVVTLRPRIIVLPGTEGMAGYRDYAFHFRGFLIGLGFCAVSGLLTALIAAGIYALLP